MATITIRELSSNASGVVKAVEKTRRPTIVTRNGRPVAMLSPLEISQDDLESWLLARAFQTSQKDALEEYAKGETRAVADVFAELEAENPERAG